MMPLGCPAHNCDCACCHALSDQADILPTRAASTQLEWNQELLHHVLSSLPAAAACACKQVFKEHCWNDYEADNVTWRLCYSDEHYFATVLATKGLDEVSSLATTLQTTPIYPCRVLHVHRFKNNECWFGCNAGQHAEERCA
jgi:hypothetical protein